MDILGDELNTSFNAHSHDDSHSILSTNLKTELDLSIIKKDHGEGETGRREPWISDRNAVLELYKNDGNHLPLLVTEAPTDILFSNFSKQKITGPSQNPMGELKLKKEIKVERGDYGSCQHERSLMKASYSKNSVTKTTNNETRNLEDHSLNNSASIPKISTVYKSEQSHSNIADELMVSCQRLGPGLLSNGDGSQKTTALCSDITTGKENQTPSSGVRPEEDKVSNVQGVQAGPGHDVVDKDITPRTGLISDLTQATSKQLVSSSNDGSTTGHSLKNGYVDDSQRFKESQRQLKCPDSGSMFDRQGLLDDHDRPPTAEVQAANRSETHALTYRRSPKRCFPTSVDKTPSFDETLRRSKRVKTQSEPLPDKKQAVPAPSQSLQTEPNLLAGTNVKKQLAHPCGRCQLSFCSRPELYHHITQKHPEFTFDERSSLTKLTSEERSLTRVATVGGSYLLYKFDKSSKKPYQCLKCDYRAAFIKNLNTHLMNHFGIRPYGCRVCQKGFVNLSGLSIHEEIHVEVKSHVCKVCGATFGGNRLLKAHMFDHGSFKCDICNNGYEYISKIGFYTHMKTHNTGVNFLCDFCGETFTNRASLGKHLSRHDSDLGGNQFPCGDCGKQFPSKRRLRSHAHRCSHSSKQCFPTDTNLSFDGTSRGSNEVKNQSESVPDKMPAVSAPSRRFQTESSLLCETKVKKQPAHPCGKCQSIFCSRPELYHHITQKHPEFTFDERSSLTKLTPEERRLTRVATVGGSYLLYKFDKSSKKPYQCLKCDYRAAFIKNLNTHLMNHFGIRPYGCRVCQKGFVNLSGLSIHEEIHVEFRSHVCKVCGATFGGIRLLKAHMFDHGSFKCDICNNGYEYISRIGFYTHMKTHNTGVNFLCEFCGETFTNRASLGQHLSRHDNDLGGNQFPCRDCGKLFPSKRRLRSHSQRCSHSPKQCFPTDTNLSFDGTSRGSNRVKNQSESVPDLMPAVSAPSGRFQTESSLPNETKVKKQPAHPCGRCQRSFCSRPELYHHITQKHPELTFDERSSLTKLTPEERRLTRVATVGGSYLLYKFDKSSKKRYQCLKCDYRGAFIKNLNTHLMNHFGIRPYGCRVCQKGFVNLSGLLIHEEIHVEVKSHVCKVCGATFGGNRLLKAHMFDHGSFKCDICNNGYEYISKIGFYTHMKTHNTGVNFLCDFCGETFTNRASLGQHLSRHDSDLGGNQFPCTECAKLFHSQRRLNQHLRHVHKRTRQCEKCIRRFYSASGLQTHMARFHQQTMPFVCELCGKGFRSSHQLKAHEFTHTGEKPYKCKECSAGFTRSDYLRKHELTHSGEKPYLCNVCGKGFSRKSNLNVHAKYHKRVDSKQN